jgi:hypothetical protein
MRSIENAGFWIAKTYIFLKVSVPIKVKLFEEAFWNYLEK